MIIGQFCFCVCGFIYNNPNCLCHDFYFLSLDDLIIPQRNKKSIPFLKKFCARAILGAINAPNLSCLRKHHTPILPENKHGTESSACLHIQTAKEQSGLRVQTIRTIENLKRKTCYRGALWMRPTVQELFHGR
jgi:hypothetical protein